MSGTAKQILVAFGLAVGGVTMWHYVGVWTFVFVLGYFAGDFWQLRRRRISGCS